MNSTLPADGTHVYVNNRFRVPYEETNAYNFEVPQFSGLNVDDGYYMAQVKSVFTEHFINTIESGRNDVFIMGIDGVLTTSVFERGYYSIYSIIDVLNAIDASCTWSYNLDERKLALAVDVTKTITFPDPDTLQVLGFSLNAKKSYSRLLYMLGWMGVAKAGGSYNNTSVEGTDPVNLNVTGVLNLNMYENLGVISSYPSNPQILAQIPVEVGFGEKIIYEPPNPPVMRINPNALEHVNFYITDEWGDAVIVPGNTPLQVHMVLFYQS